MTELKARDDSCTIGQEDGLNNNFQFVECKDFSKQQNSKKKYPEYFLTKPFEAIEVRYKKHGGTHADLFLDFSGSLAWFAEGLWKKIFRVFFSLFCVT